MPFEETRSSLYQFDETFRRKGFQRVAGIDEVGRGPFAGPVVASICLFPASFYLPQINDSKSLTEKQRYSIYRQLVSSFQVEFGIGLVDVQTLDQMGVHQASFLAMKRAYDTLLTPPDCLLIDGKHPPHGLPSSVHQEMVIGGDKRSALIAAASILAKVRRDWIMEQIHNFAPDYRFDEHKGYGTKKHKEALEMSGIVPGVHRTSFAPIQKIMK